MSGKASRRFLTEALKLCYVIHVKQKGTLALTVCTGLSAGAALLREGKWSTTWTILPVICRPSGRTHY